jgi:hypothetical protein
MTTVIVLSIMVITFLLSYIIHNMSDLPLILITLVRLKLVISSLAEPG